MVGQVTWVDFDDRGGMRWVDRWAPLTNGQLLELRGAIETQGAVIRGLQEGDAEMRERLTALEGASEELDRSVGVHDDRLDAIELGLDGALSGAAGGVPEGLGGDGLPCPSSRVAAGLAGDGGPGSRAVVSLEEFATLHELGATLARVYRRVGITSWEQALATWRVGWEMSVPREERLPLETVWGFLQRCELVR
jgi:hypothetical protein